MPSITDRTRDSVIDHPLGTLGLVLIGLTAWGVEHLQMGRMGRIPARLVLASVAGLGWVVDRFGPGRGTLSP
jgi:hypothetical protein